MADRKRMASVITARVKRLDPETIVQGTLYDEVSGRLVVTVVNGTRRLQMVVPVRWFENGYREQLNRALKDAIERLRQSPTG